MPFLGSEADSDRPPSPGEGTPKSTLEKKEDWTNKTLNLFLTSLLHFNRDREVYEKLQKSQTGPNETDCLSEVKIFELQGCDFNLLTYGN